MIPILRLRRGVRSLDNSGLHTILQVLQVISTILAIYSQMISITAARTRRSR